MGTKQFGKVYQMSSFIDGLVKINSLHENCTIHHLRLNPHTQCYLQSIKFFFKLSWNLETKVVFFFFFMPLFL